MACLFFVYNVNAQDTTSSDGGGMKFQFTSRLDGSPHRDLGIYAGVTLAGSEGVPEMNLLASFSMPKTSFALSYVIYPMPNRSFGKFFGFGLEGIYFYKCDVNIYSRLSFGIPVTDVLRDIGLGWMTQRIAVAPIVEFSVPLNPSKTIRMGLKINPFPWGYWDFLYRSNGWTHAKQYFNINYLYFQMNFGKNSE